MNRPQIWLLLAMLGFTHTPALAQIDQPTPEPAGDVILVGTDVADAPADIETLLGKTFPSVDQFQKDHFAKFGAYAQVLPLYTNTPADGIAELPTDLEAKPTDGVKGADLWTAIGEQAYPANLHIDVYDGPSGLGYVLVVQAKFNGQLWQREINVGPEDYRNSDWTVVP